MSSLPAAATACVMTPHEAVLRSRLEKVLSMGREEVERGVGGGGGELGRKRRSRDSNKGDHAEWLWNSQDVSTPPSIRML